MPPIRSVARSGRKVGAERASPRRSPRSTSSQARVTAVGRPRDTSAATLGPAVKPALLTEEALHYMSDRLKMQIIEWADKLTRQPDPHTYLWSLLDKGAR